MVDNMRRRPSQPAQQSNPAPRYVAPGTVALPAPPPGFAPSRTVSTAAVDSRFARGSKLHIGCGPKHIAGWLNTDTKAGIGPDGVVDLMAADLPRGWFRGIYLCHVLEHVWIEKTPTILKHLADALMPGGTLRISVPDIRLIVENCVDGHDFGTDANPPLFGDYREAALSPDRHRQAFWEERLTQLLEAAGLTNIRRWVPEQYPEIKAVHDWSDYPTISLNMEGDRPPAPKPLQESTDGEPQSDARVDVSVLLGTVRRPEMVRECIESIRSSLAGSPFTCEIVVAYGETNDPALPWLRLQPDVVPILGGMAGAIPAFNAAYSAASRGRYICQINDDVLLQGTGLANAIRHLDADADLGAVVFWMSRDGGKTYPDINYDAALGAPELPHPNQIVARRELCEDIIAEGLGAFWGDEVRRTHKTYAGDTSWGVWAARLGWRIERRDDVKLIDRMDETVADPNRLANMEGYVPALELWYRLYPRGSHAPIARGELAWPRVYVPQPGMLPRRSPVLAGPPERVLHLAASWLAVDSIGASRGSTGEPQPDLHRQLATLGPYRMIRWVERFREVCVERTYDEVIEAIVEHQPTLIWMQIQRDTWFGGEMIDRMRAAAPPGCLIISWTGDVRTSAVEPVERWMVDHARHADLFLSSECTYPELLVSQEGIPTFKTGLQICGGDVIENAPRGGDPAEFPEAVGKAVFVGSSHFQYPGVANRADIMRTVSQALPGMLTCYGTGWDGESGVRAGKFVTKPERARLHSLARVAVIQSLFTDLRRYTSDRLQGSMLTGAFCAIQRFSDMEGYGLRDGVNCVIWDDAPGLIALLQDWLRPERDEQREEIRRAGRNLALREMTWHASMEQLMAIVRAERRRRLLAGLPGGQVT